MVPETTVVSPETEEVKPTRVRIRVVFILFLVLLVAYLDRVNVSVMLADPAFIGEMDLKSNPTAQGLVMSCFLFAYGIGNFILGPIGDKLGPRKAMSFSIFSWGVAVILGALSRALTPLYLSRAILGLGEAMHWPMQSSYVRNWFPVSERGRANSAWGAGQFTGPALAMPVFAFIIGQYGWRASFWFCAALGFAVLPLLWFYTKDRPDEHAGVNQAELTYILAGQPDGTVADPERVSVLDNIAYILTQSNFYLNTVAQWSMATAWWGVMTWLPQYLKVARGFSWAQMGMLSSLPYVLGVIGVLSVGYFSDRFSRRAPFALLAIVGQSVCIYLGAVVTDNLSSAYLMALSMFFAGMYVPMTWSIVQTIVPGSMVGAAAGMQNGSAQFVGALAPLAIGYLIDVTGSYTGGLMYIVGFGTVGSLGMLCLAARKI